MGIPKALASLLRAMTQPSLLERITTGFLPIAVEKPAHKRRKNYYNLPVQTWVKGIKMFVVFAKDKESFTVKK